MANELISSATILEALANPDSGTAIAIARPNVPVPGISGLRFDIPNGEDIELAAESTDLYIENNSAIQDHIIIKPIRITLRGSFGDLVLFSPTPLPQPKTEINPLPALPEYAPPLTQGQLQTILPLQLEAERLHTLENSYVPDAFSIFRQALVSSNRQANAFAYFYNLIQNRVLFSVETPWGIFTNMMIENVKASQSGNTNNQTDFDIIFKQVRIARGSNITNTLIDGRVVLPVQSVRDQDAKNQKTAGTPGTQTPSSFDSFIGAVGLKLGSMLN